MKVTDRKTMVELQGDLVLMIVDREEIILTIVHFVDGDNRELQLVNRGVKPHEREYFPMTQAVLDNLVPAKHKVAKWKLNMA